MTGYRSDKLPPTSTAMAPIRNSGTQIMPRPTIWAAVLSVSEWSYNTLEALHFFMTNCKENWHDDPEFADWHSELRGAAGGVVQAVENLQKIAQRYDIIKMT